MSLRLRHNLWKTKRSLGPSRDFTKRLWKNLDQTWQANQWPGFLWYQTGWFKFSAAALAVIIVSASLGTGTYAYTNPEVSDGHILFPLKESIEVVEEKLQRTPEKKAAFYLKQIERREIESAVIEKKRGQANPRLEAKIEQSELKLAAIERQLVSSTIKNVPLQKAIKKNLEKRKEHLEERRAGLSKPTTTPRLKVRLEQQKEEQKNDDHRREVLERRIEKLNQNLQVVNQVLEKVEERPAEHSAGRLQLQELQIRKLEQQRTRLGL